MCLQVTELCELSQITLSCGSVESKVTDNLFRGEFAFIGHEFQNIDQFLCQRGLYRPFIDYFLLQILFIDHFRCHRRYELVDIILFITSDKVTKKQEQNKIKSFIFYAEFK